MPFFGLFGFWISHILCNLLIEIFQLFLISIQEILNGCLVSAVFKGGTDQAVFCSRMECLCFIRVSIRLLRPNREMVTWSCGLLPAQGFAVCDCLLLKEARAEVNRDMV